MLPPTAATPPSEHKSYHDNIDDADLTKEEAEDWCDGAGGSQGSTSHQRCSSRHDGHTRHWEQVGIM